MAKGIIYLMSTVVDGLIKIGKTDNYERRMKELEKNGYRNVPGLKREFAIELNDYDEKETLLQTIFSKSKLGDTELFSIDIDIAKQLLSAFDGKIIYPKEDKNDIFVKATDAVEEKELIKALDINRHHFKEIDFTSSLTGKKYHGQRGEEGTLVIINISTGQEIPNNSNPSKKAIIGQAIKDLGGTTDNSDTLYQRYRKLTKLVLKQNH